MNSEPRSSRREEAHSDSGDGSQSLLTSAPTVEGDSENSPPAFVAELAGQLRVYQGLCAEVLALTGRESQALAAAGDYQPFEFFQGRKALLSRLDEGLNLLRTWRQAWQRLDPAERARHSEVKTLLQAVQDSLVKILVLDRENQQALLRRGLVPARHLPSFAGPQPHFAAQLYRRHSAS